MNNDNLKSLWGTLKECGYNPPKYEEFAKDMENDDNLRGVYSTLQKEGYTPPEYEVFRKDMGLGSNQASPAAGQNTDFTIPDEEVYGKSGKPLPELVNTENGLQPRPTKNLYEIMDRERERKFTPKQQPKAETATPTPKKEGALDDYKQEADRSMRQMMEGVRQTGAGIKKQEQYRQGVLVNRFDNGRQRIEIGNTKSLFDKSNPRVIEGETFYNPVTKKLEKTYLNASGEYNNRTMAERDQAKIDDTINRKLKPIETQLADAYAERDRLLSLLDERRLQLVKKDKDKPFMAKFAEAFAAQGGAPVAGLGKDIETDPTYQDYMTALRKNKELITTLEDAHQNNTNSFWHSFRKEIFNGYTFSPLGKSKIQDIVSLIGAKNKADVINSKRKKGESLTQDEMSAEAVLKNAAWDKEVQDKYGDQYDAWARAGKMGATSLDFMADFLMMGGLPASTAKGVLSGVEKYGAKVLGEQATKGLGKYMLKTTGVTLGTMVAGAEISNTIQLGKTAAEAGEKYIGDVFIDKDGEYVFGHMEDDGNGGQRFVEGGDSFLGSILTAERDAISENASEVAGEFLPGSSIILKGMEKVGLSKLANNLTAIGGKNWYKAYTKALETAGFHGVPGEAFEEYIGTAYNTIMGGDEWKNLSDPRTHIDIWLGCATMGAYLNAPRLAGTGYQMAQYYRYKHNTDNANKTASWRFTEDVWNPIRERIDEATNEQISDVVADILNNETKSPDQRKAVFDYALNLQRMRGWSLGSVASDERKDDTQPKTEEEKAINEQSQSYAEGYNTTEPQDMNDAKNRFSLLRQKAIEMFGEDDINLVDDYTINRLLSIANANGYTANEKQILLDYVNAKGTYEGMIQRVRDNMDGRVVESDSMIDCRINKQDGMLHPATLKADDRKVYIVGGNVIANEDGSIDREKSDESVVLRDAETGKLEYADPRDILTIDDTIDANEEKQRAAEAIQSEFAQQAANQIDGVLPFNVGDTYQILGEDGQHEITILPLPEGTAPVQGAVFASIDGQEPSLIEAANVQQMADNANYARLQQAEEERSASLAEMAAEAQAPEQQTYNQDDEVTLNTDNGAVNGTIINITEDGYEVETEQPINGKTVNLFTPEELAALTQAQDGMPEKPTDQMPMNGDEPDFAAVTPQRSHQYIYNEAELTREEADQFVNAKKKEADAALEKIKNKKPKMGTSIAKYKQEQGEYQQKVDAAQAAADYWKAVKDEQFKVMQAELEENRKQFEAQIEEAAEQEKVRQAEELQKQQTAAELGANNVAPSIREKWDAAEKVEGVRNEIVLANGDKVPGRYILVESGAATPSHNPNAEFIKNEGYPVDENGQSVNDRDYERDTDAQGITRQIADNYDQRALQTPVVVSNDGVVLSGNGRTMAGELAAQNGTDGAYIDYLKEYGSQYGFTPEQVEAMQHPRVMFVPDSAMPYTAETFAKFNQQEMKGQNKTEQAVKLGKIVDDDTFARIIRTINNFETLGDFYADQKAATEAINELRNADVVSQAEYTEMFDGDGISAAGKEILENTLIGKALEGNPDAVRQIATFKSVRQSIVSALAEISNNIALGEEYSVADELQQAISLVYEARNNGYKAGEKVSMFARQGNLFTFDEGDTVADYTNVTIMLLADMLNDNRTTMLKKWLSNYNADAKSSANGQLDLFAGDVMDKKTILDEINQTLDYGTEQPTEQARGSESTEQDATGNEGNEGSEPVEPAAKPISDEEADAIISSMKMHSVVAPVVEITDSNWRNNIQTPLGNVKMGANQKEKLFVNGREQQYGMLLETLVNPDIVLEERDKEENMFHERPSSYLFIKTFQKEDGTKYVHFESVTVSQEGFEVSVSSHIIRENQLRNKLKSGRLLYKATALDEPANSSAEQPTNEGSSLSSDGKGIEISNTNQEKEEKSSTTESIAAAEQEVNTDPTEGQKKAGNYKMGHVKVDGYDITIENPKGSVRSGKDADGKEWSQEMHNTYGYIKGTEGVDGDHIDIFLSDNPEEGNVFVIDQVDQMGIFDEHKVMYGFNSAEEARSAYLSNYEEGWQGLGAITEVSKDEFKKWIESSHRKTKPFSEYKSVKAEGAQNENKSIDLQREYVRKYLINENPIWAGMADLMTDEEIAKFNQLIEAWEKPNDEFGRIFEEQYNTINYSKDKAAKEAAQKLVDDAREKANEAFKPVEQYFSEMDDKYGSQLDDMPELVSAPKKEEKSDRPKTYADFYKDAESEIDAIASKLDSKMFAYENDAIVQQIADIYGELENKMQADGGLTTEEQARHDAAEKWLQDTIWGEGETTDTNTKEEKPDTENNPNQVDLFGNKVKGEQEKVSKPRINSKKIDDFGEKIGGARKDVARDRIKDSVNLTGKDLQNLKKGADDILSRDNIIRLFKEGQMDEDTARNFLALNNVCKTILKKGYGHWKEYIMNKYRGAAVEWEEGEAPSFEVTEKDIDEWMEISSTTKRESAIEDFNYHVVDPFNSYVNTYKAINYPAVNRKVGQYVIKDYTNMLSRHIVTPRPYWFLNGYRAQRGYPFNTMEEAVNRMQEACPVVEEKAKKKSTSKAEHGLHVVAGGVYGFVIKSRNIPGDIILSKTFNTKEQAEEYLNKNIDRLMERESRLVDALMGSNIGMAEREGIDYREGRDVTPDDFLNEFGFRGVEFGNWVPQGERQMYLNKTYDAIKDFCSIIGISPKAFSLGGRLGLAFGARGTSRALAHYEPAKEVINLTRMRGVGSLAHEWFHALDNYLAKQKTGNTSDMATVTRDVVREELALMFKDMVEKVRSMDYDTRSNRAGEYWGRMEEEFARLFQSYIFNKLAAKETKSPILVRQDVLYDFADEDIKSRYPYPSIEENKEMEPYFDSLFKTIQERTDENGNVVLFHAVPNSTLSKEVSSEEAALRDAVVDLMRETGIDVVTDVELGQQTLDENIKKSGKNIEEYDRAAQKEYLLSDNYVSVLTGNEFAKSEEPLTKRVSEFYSNNYGGKIERDGVGSILLDERSVKDSIAHGIGRNKAIAFAAVPEIIKDGAIINRQENWKNRGYGSVTFAAPVKIGNDGYVGIVVANEVTRSDGSHRFYLHEVALQKNLLSEEFKTGINTGSKQGDIANVLKIILSAKESDKKMHEMRVYHGSGADFDRFDHSHMGEGEGAQAFGWGSYVTQVEAIGKKYATAVSNRPVGARKVLYRGEDFRGVVTVGWAEEKEGAFIDIADGMQSMGKSAEKAIDDLRIMTEHSINNQKKALDYATNRTGLLENVLAYFKDEKKLTSLSEDEKKIVENVIKETNNTQEAIEDAEFMLDNNKKLKSMAVRRIPELEERLKYINEFDAADFTRESNLPILYTVEIPDEKDATYLEYNKRMFDQTSLLEKVYDALTEAGWERRDVDTRTVFDNGLTDMIFAPHIKGSNLYEELGGGLGSYQAASEFLNSIGITGIKYPANYHQGGTTNGESNYVIFNENDLKITEKARLFRTANGQIYGYTLGGKIFIDTSIATSETPIHEYVHLWAEALRKANTKAWEQLTNEMLGQEDVLNYVKGCYPELEGDELIEEVFAHYAGNRGAERLREEQAKAMDEAKGIFEKANVAIIFDKIRKALSRFWNMTRDLFAGKVDGMDKIKAEDFADMAFNDLLNKFNPLGEAIDTVEKEENKGYEISDFEPGKGMLRLRGIEEANITVDGKKAGHVYKFDNEYYAETPSMDYATDLYPTADEAVQALLNRDEDEGLRFRLREDEAPKKTGIGYKVFVLKDGQLYPPMVANPNGEATPVGVWLDADAAPIVGETKTGRPQVKAGGKGTQGGSGTLAYRPGWHLGTIPYALQFNRKDANGEKTLFPANFVWAEVEYANDIDYQQEATEAGTNENGKYQHSLAGLKEVPVNGSYIYRTNPNPETDPWIITGAMKVNRILKPSEVDTMVREAGREPQQRQEGAVTDADVEALDKDIKVRKVESIINEAKSKYNSKQIQFIRLDTVKDDELLTALGVPNEIIAELSPEELHEEVEMVKEEAKRKNSTGGYNPSNRKITIFADNIPLYQTEEFFFHENIHGILHDLYENGVKGIAERFYDVAPKDGDIIKWSFIEKGYKDKEEAQRKEEFFTYWLSRAMVQGGVSDMLNLLNDEDAERTENILNIIGYERRTEEESRREKSKGKSLYQENSEGLSGQQLYSRGGEGQNIIGYERGKEEALRKGERKDKEILSDNNSGAEGSVRRRAGNEGEELTPEESLAASRRAGYTKRQHDAWVKRQDKLKWQAAEDAISKLNLLGKVDIRVSANGLTGRKAKSKGWFDTNTGRITVILGNHNSAADVVKTVLHEAVAHYGLRAMFGSRFDTFLDNVYENAAMDIRHDITALVAKHGWNFREATEEYLASLAENTSFERAMQQGWWPKIKTMFLNMLHDLGFDFYGGGIIGDNELRYILWRSYENLAEPGKYRNIFAQAKDISMQYELGVGDYKRKRIQKLGKLDTSRIGKVAEQDDSLRHRDGEDFSERDRAIARDAYERMMASGMTQFREAMQDSMLGLKKVYEAILGNDTHIEDVAGFENAYLAENRMSSINAAEQHEYFVNFMAPILDAVGKIAGSDKEARQELVDYMMAKHGLERNLKFAERDARADEKNGKDYDAAFDNYRKRDYAGLTALTETPYVEDAELYAQDMVNQYEANHDTTELWDVVRNATHATIEKVYRSGLLSKESYENIRDMFDYYIPLQGWDEKTSDEVYGYLTSKNGPFGGNPIKQAKGRSSKADDPIATIGLMADDVIRAGNRNLMKQRFLNFVLNNPSDLVSVSDLWLKYDETSDEWVPVFPDLNEKDSASEVERKVEDFNERMKALADADPEHYKKGKDAKHLPYKVVKNNLKEHQVLVKRGGHTYVLTINGNPRAAQALNGLTNPDVEIGGLVGKLTKLGEYVNHTLSAFYTKYYPDFVVSNLFRDMLYSNCMTWVKESPSYALAYHKNFGKYNPVMMRRLLGKWEQGTLDDNNQTEHLFKQFMLNGGETGFTSIRDIDAHKKVIQDELKKQGSAWRKGLAALGMQLDLMNRSIENCARFAAFVTSREFGRTIDRSIYDSKEVSVNFNKKGAGGKMLGSRGQERPIARLLITPKTYFKSEDRTELLAQIGSYTSGIGRLFYVFWNASVQGLTNFGRAGKRHPAKAFAGAAALYTLGYIIPQLAKFMGDDDDDDKNAYYNLPEYIRRSNICIYAGDKWITIPLPIEYRSIYGLGELAYGAISDNERYTSNELAFQMGSQVSQILPLDMLEGGGGYHAFIPSSVKPYVEAYWINRSWTGLPIYKNTPKNQNDPEYTKVYKNTDKTLVAMAEWLNEHTKTKEYEDKGVININPAKLEYFLKGVFGGYATTAEKLKKMGETAIGQREFDWRNMLIANRIIKTGDERTANKKMTNEYFNYKDEYTETKRLLKKYEDEMYNGVPGAEDKLKALQNSEEYKRYLVFDEYNKDINDLYKLKSDTPNEEQKKMFEQEYNETVRELIDAIHNIKD